MRDRRSHITFDAPVTEMQAASDLAGLVRVDSSYIKDITEGDDNPQYLIVEIDEQQSGNKINYNRQAFELIAAQVNDKQPVGYSGHKHMQGADKEDLLPDPQLLWLGASVVPTTGGKSKLVAKAYVLPEPEAKGRAWLKRKVVNSVSWAGDAILSPAKSGGYDMKEYFLESIDFSRKNKEGLKGQRLTVVTEEFEDDKFKGGKSKVKDENDQGYEEIVSRLTMPDLKAHNPALLKTITEMAKDEVKDETATAVQTKTDELEAKHTKELSEVPEISLMQKIKDVLGIGEDGDPITSLTSFLEHLDTVSKQAVKNWFETDILAKKVPNEKARKLVARLIPVTEMEGDWRSDKGIDKIKVDLEARVDDALENDDLIKETVKEMGASRGGLRLHNGSGSESRSSNSDNKDKDDKSKSYERSGNLEYEEVSIGN